MDNQVWPLEEFLRVLITLTREKSNNSKHEFLEIILPTLPLSATQIKTEVLKRVTKMQSIFDKIKSEMFGSGQGKSYANVDNEGDDDTVINQNVLDALDDDFVFKSQSNCVDGDGDGDGDDDGVLGPDSEFDSDVELLTQFVEHWISVSLKDPSTRNLAKTLNCHHCFKRSCQKKSPKCRYHFPRFPSLKTIIAIPSKVKFPDEEVRVTEVQKSKALKQKVKNILEDKNAMSALCQPDEQSIEDYVEWLRLAQLVDFIKECKLNPKDNEPKLVDEAFVNRYNQFVRDIRAKLLSSDNMGWEVFSQEGLESFGLGSQDNYQIVLNTLLQNIITKSEINFEDFQDFRMLDRFKKYCIGKVETFDMDKLARNRLFSLLKAAGLCENGCSEECSKDCLDDQLTRYEEALHISERGYEVILKRDIDEIMINNFNPEWIKAWDSNMDIQLCLDYYAVICYITDYYMKDESGTIDFIKDALKNDESGNLKKQMNLVKNTFLTHRQAGECEIYYKLFPFLNLTSSNIAAFFIPTGFMENMSRFLLSVSDEEANWRPNAVEVEGKEGKLYTESSNFYDKYLSRHEQVHCMSYIQFAQRYKVSKKKDLGEIDWQNEFYGYLGSDVLCADDDIAVADVDDPDAIVGNDGDDPDDIVVSDGDDPDNDDDMYVGHKMSKRGLKVTSQIKDDDFIVEYSPSETGRKMLPRFIPIIASNGVSYMQLSSKRVVRFHKFSQNKSPHEFYFSELQKYVPFKKEEQFFPKDIEACKTFYEQNLNLINFYKGKVLPHFDGVSAGRAKGEKLASDIGDILDANRAQEDDAALEEGEHQNPAMAVLEPTLDQLLNSDPPTKSTKGAYRQIDVQDEASLSAKIRTLDPEQRFVVDKVMDFARRLRRAENQPGKNERPTPPHLLVLGNGGTGKSHVIDVLSQLLQKTLSKSGDNPDHPYIVRVAFTGNASLLIKGQT